MITLLDSAKFLWGTCVQHQYIFRNLFFNMIQCHISINIWRLISFISIYCLTEKKGQKTPGEKTAGTSFTENSWGVALVVAPCAVCEPAGTLACQQTADILQINMWKVRHQKPRHILNLQKYWLADPARRGDKTWFGMKMAGKDI